MMITGSIFLKIFCLTSLKNAKERQLRDLLMSEEGTVPIEEALTNAKNKTQKNLKEFKK